jgi:hypothetical protein
MNVDGGGEQKGIALRYRVAANDGRALGPWLAATR